MKKHAAKAGPRFPYSSMPKRPTKVTRPRPMSVILAQGPLTPDERAKLERHYRRCERFVERHFPDVDVRSATRLCADAMRLMKWTSSHVTEALVGHATLRGRQLASQLVDAVSRVLQGEHPPKLVGRAKFGRKKGGGGVSAKRRSKIVRVISGHTRKPGSHRGPR